ncbi:SDR family oxidoreductase [Aquibium sp. ELW1220]|uniref:SDR family NAD(P)-dependent oxidoreductase n=1 Tax=Aquibium sp. ELW1220 TaxID=2976766 RepID=UPI0025B0E48B|nr:SDR family oxidoreductase [Aquibium sp. ELW1220]MDN2583173.1 SDR family oxidoreductase [Aquibium sp. ELW1220]
MTDIRRIAVLGGAGGIGRALVNALVEGGDEVVVLDLAASLERHSLDVPSVAVDVLSEASIGTAMQELSSRVPALDGFVNLAGYNSRIQPLAETSSDYFDDVIAGNLRGAFLSTKAVMPLMAEGGSVVMVASGLAHFVRPGYGSYAAAKAGVVALTKTFAHEWALTVRVNAVAPGLVDTAFLRGGTGRSDESGESVVSLEAYRNAIPMKRLAYPDDVVGPIRFLLGQDSAYMTGQVLWVNGGGYMP